VRTFKIETKRVSKTIAKRKVNLEELLFTTNENIVVVINF